MTMFIFPSEVKALSELFCH